MVGSGGELMVKQKQEQVVMVPMSKIDPPGEAQRNMIDPIKIIELAESIRENGLQEPILLRPLNGRYEIVFGHRRFLAHHHLKVLEIRSFVRELDDIQVVVLRGIENLQRENLTPLEEAKTYFLMRTQGGMSLEGICKRTGKVLSTVKRYLRFYEMPPEFQTAVDQEGLSLGVAEVLMDIGDPKMRLYYLNMAVKNGITVMVAQMWVDEYNKSIQGKLFEDTGGSQGAELTLEQKPVYVTCQVCYAPVEIHQAKQLIVCDPCHQQARKMKSSKP